MKGRIPQHFIDELLSRLDIVEVIDRRVPLKKSGRNYTARCPFHEEKTPSFSVNPDKQFYYCFGCGAGGNAISFIMEFERQDFPQAVDTLASAAGLDVPREQVEQPEKIARRKDIYSLMDQAADFYKRQLRQHPQAQRAVDYLRSRGLTGEIARDFDIGFAPPGWDNLLKALGSEPRDRQLLVDGGMLISKDDGKVYDRFRDRIIFPIRDNRGRIIAFGGRVLGDDKPKYLNSPETEIFHKGRELYGLFQTRQSLRTIDRLLMVEGYMDVVALAQYGIRYAVATLGTATSAEHLRKVFRYTGEVVFCFDGDDAGRRAAQRALETTMPLMEDGRQARFLFMPEGEDPDSLIRDIGPHRFERLIEQAQPLEDYLFSSLEQQVNPDTLEGKAKLSKLASPLLQLLPEGVYKQLMLDALAQRTGLSGEALQTVLNQNPPKPVEAPPPAPEPQRAPLPEEAKTRRDPLLYAISLILHNPRALSRLDNPLEQLTGLDNTYLPTLQSLITLLQERPESSTAMLLGHWHGQPEGEILTQALHLEHPPYDEEKTAEALQQILGHIHQLQTKNALSQLVDKLRDANYADLTDDEKQQLNRLLQAQHPSNE